MSLPFILLGLINNEPNTGYNLTKKFDKNSVYQSIWASSHQQVYRELNKLTNEGKLTFVTQENDGKPDSKIYKITKEGSESLSEWIGTNSVMTTIRDSITGKIISANASELELIVDVIDCQISMIDTRIGNLNEIVTEHKDPLVQLKNEIAIDRGLSEWISNRQWCIDTKEKIQQFLNLI